MSKIPRKWIELDYDNDNALSAEVILYSETETIKNAIDSRGILFGQDYQYNSDTGSDWTNSENYQEKLSLETSVIPAGLYMIGWSYEFRQVVITAEWFGRVALDGGDTFAKMLSEVSIKNIDGASFYPCGGFAEWEFDSTTDHEIIIEYCTGTGGTAFIRNAMLEIFRIG